MKLGIIELDHHLECLHSLCAILEGSDISVTVFTTAKLAEELEGYSYYNKFDWQLSSGKIITYLAQQTALFNKQDLLFFSTTESKFATFNRLKLKAPYLVRIHNANTFLEDKKSWSIRLTPYWLFKDTSYVFRKLILENEIKERNRFLEKASFLCFTSEEITEYIKGESNYKYKEKIIDAVPITFNSLLPQPILEVNKIAVIGTIDKKRKDYPLLLKSIEKIKAQTNRAFELKLMGRPKGQFGKKMIRDFMKLQGNLATIKTWPHGLPQSDFDKEMSEVDVIIAPIYSTTKNFLIKELYGKTKISGSINDCIKYGKPGVFPEFYPLPKGLDSVFYTYKNSLQLEQIVLDMLEGKLIPEIKKEEIQKFGLESIGQKVVDQLKQLVNS